MRPPNRSSISLTAGWLAASSCRRLLLSGDGRLGGPRRPPPRPTRCAPSAAARSPCAPGRGTRRRAFARSGRKSAATSQDDRVAFLARPCAPRSGWASDGRACTSASMPASRSPVAGAAAGSARPRRAARARRRRTGAGGSGAAGAWHAAPVAGAARRGWRPSPTRAAAGGGAPPASARRARPGRSNGSSRRICTILSSASSSVTRGSCAQRRSVLDLGQHVEDAQQVLFRERRRRAGAAARAPRARAGASSALSSRRQLEQQDLAEVQQQLAVEVAVVGAVVGEALDQLEQRQAVALGHRARRAPAAARGR